ncbi:hypothetical protein [Pelatocladus sp. BLCC-F211]
MDSKNLKLGLLALRIYLECDRHSNEPNVLKHGDCGKCAPDFG